MSTLFPAPLGPRMTVRGPAVISMETRSMIVLPFMANDTSSRIRGSTLNPRMSCKETGGHRPGNFLAVAPLRGFLHPVRRRVQSEHEREQHDTQPQRQRQIAL